MVNARNGCTPGRGIHKAYESFEQISVAPFNDWSRDHHLRVLINATSRWMMNRSWYKRSFGVQWLANTHPRPDQLPQANIQNRAITPMPHGWSNNHGRCSLLLNKHPPPHRFNDKWFETPLSLPPCARADLPWEPLFPPPAWRRCLVAPRRKGRPLATHHLAAGLVAEERHGPARPLRLLVERHHDPDAHARVTDKVTLTAAEARALEDLRRGSPRPTSLPTRRRQRRPPTPRRRRRS